MAKKQKELDKSTTVSDVDQFIYVGPNLAGGRLLQYTVFRGGKPAYLQDVFEAHPAIEKLIVPVAELTEVQESLKNPGTLEAHFYQEALKHNAKGDK